MNNFNSIDPNNLISFSSSHQLNTHHHLHQSTPELTPSPSSSNHSHPQQQQQQQLQKRKPSLNQFNQPPTKLKSQIDSFDHDLQPNSIRPSPPSSVDHHHSEFNQNGKNKRKEQNRNAQRAFRERKEKKLNELQQQVDELLARQEPLTMENRRLTELVNRLKSENQELSVYKQAFTFTLSNDLRKSSMPLSSQFEFSTPTSSSSDLMNLLTNQTEDLSQTSNKLDRFVNLEPVRTSRPKSLDFLESKAVQKCPVSRPLSGEIQQTYQSIDSNTNDYQKDQFNQTSPINLSRSIDQAILNQNSLKIDQIDHLPTFHPSTYPKPFETQNSTNCKGMLNPNDENHLNIELIQDGLGSSYYPSLNYQGNWTQSILTETPRSELTETHKVSCLTSSDSSGSLKTNRSVEVLTPSQTFSETNLLTPTPQISTLKPRSIEIQTCNPNYQSDSKDSRYIQIKTKIDKSDQMNRFINEGRISSQELNELCDMFKEKATCQEKRNFWGQVVAVKPEWHPIREEFRRCIKTSIDHPV